MNNTRCLSTQLDETKTSFISADVRASATQEHLEEAEEYLHKRNIDSSEKQRHLVLLSQNILRRNFLRYVN